VIADARAPSVHAIHPHSDAHSASANRCIVTLVVVVLAVKEHFDHSGGAHRHSDRESETVTVACNMTFMFDGGGAALCDMDDERNHVQYIGTGTVTVRPPPNLSTAILSVARDRHRHHAYRLDEQGVFLCWHSDRKKQFDAPAGCFFQITGAEFFCGVIHHDTQRTRTACWAWSDGYDRHTSPSASFRLKEIMNGCDDPHTTGNHFCQHVDVTVGHSFALCVPGDVVRRAATASSWNRAVHVNGLFVVDSFEVGGFTPSTVVRRGYQITEELHDLEELAWSNHPSQLGWIHVLMKPKHAVPSLHHRGDTYLDMHPLQTVSKMGDVADHASSDVILSTLLFMCVAIVMSLPVISRYMLVHHDASPRWPSQRHSITGERVQRKVKLVWQIWVCCCCLLVPSAPYQALGGAAPYDDAVNIATSLQCSSASSVYKDTTNGIVYAACLPGGIISINGSTVTTIATSSQCPIAYSVHKDTTNGLVYAACQNDGGIISINGSVVTTIATSSQCPGASSVYKDTTNGIVYAACQNDGGIISINGSTVTTIATSSQCPSAYSVYKDTTNGIVYAACTTGGIISIAGSTVTTIAPSSRCPNAHSVYKDTTNGIIYAACGDGDLIALLPAITLATSSQCPDAPSLYKDTTNGIVYAACSGGGIISISGSTVATIATPSQCPNAMGVYKDTTKGIVYAACYIDGVISIAGSTVTTIATAPQCPRPYSVYGDTTNGIVYAACLPGGIISINGSTVTTIATSSQCPNAYSVHKDTTNGLVYAACQNDGGIISINGSIVTTIATSSQCPNAHSVYKDTTNGIVYGACRVGIVALTDEKCVEGTSFQFGSCLQCPSGYFRRNVQSNLSCLRCPAGSVTPSQGSIRCTPCEVGWYASSSPPTCFPCLPGKYQNSTGSSSCHHCPLGSFNDAAPASQCTECDVGRFTNVTGGMSCTYCNLGEYQSERGKTTCLQASIGFFVPEIGSTSQHECPVGRYSHTNGTISCSYCASGSYQPLTGQISCQEADPGWFVGSSGATEMTECPAGRFSNSSASTSCTLCEAGFAQRQPHQTSCAICGVGSFSRDSGATTCRNCTAGSFSPINGSSQCQPCGLGRYQPQEGKAECMPAQPGFYVDRSGSAEVVVCPVGTYTSSSAGASSCTPCSRGSASNMTGVASDDGCPICTSGQFSDLAGRTSCFRCPAGFYAPANESYSCEPCPVGYYQHLTGQDKCLPAPMGWYVDSTGSTEYKPCQPGSFSSQNGSSSCGQCNRGSASNITGLTVECPVCLPGKYQSGIGKTSCFDCDPLMYSETAGSVSCTICPEGLKLNEGRTSCDAVTCPPNWQYSNELRSCQVCPLGSASSAGGKCSICNVGYFTPSIGIGCVSCDSEGLICSNGLASVREGYWAYRANVTMEMVDGEGGVRLQVVEIYQTVPCPKGFCPGSSLQSSNTSATEADGSATIQSHHYCEPPRLDSSANTMCGECEDGYILWGSSCIICDGANGGLIFGTVVLSLLFTAFLIRSSSGNSGAGSMVVLLYFVQTAMLQVGDVSRLISWLGFVNFDILFAGDQQCIAKVDPYGQILFSALMPLLLVGEVIVLGVAHWMMMRYVERKGMADELISAGQHRSADGPSVAAAVHTGSTGTTNGSNMGTSSAQGWKHSLRLKLIAFSFSFNPCIYQRGFLSVLLFCYTSVSLAVFKYLHCVDVGDETRLFVSPSLSCDSVDYNTYFIPIGMMLALYVVGFPIVTLFFLCINRRHISSVAAVVAHVDVEQHGPSKPEAVAAEELPSPSCNSSSSTWTAPSMQTSSANSTQQPQTSRFARRWGPLYAMYEVRAWYWQPIVLARRALFTLVAIMLVDDPLYRTICFNVLNLTSLVSHAHIHPFSKPMLNRAESASHSILLLISTLLSAVPPSTSSDSVPEWLQVLLLFLVLLPVLCFSIYIVHRHGHVVSGRVKNHIQTKWGQMGKKHTSKDWTEARDQKDGKHTGVNEDGGREVENGEGGGNINHADVHMSLHAAAIPSPSQASSHGYAEIMASCNVRVATPSSTANSPVGGTRGEPRQDGIEVGQVELLPVVSIESESRSRAVSSWAARQAEASRRRGHSMQPVLRKPEPRPPSTSMVVSVQTDLTSNASSPVLGLPTRPQPPPPPSSVPSPARAQL